MTATSEVVIDVRIICNARVPICRHCWDTERPWTASGRSAKAAYEDRNSPGQNYMLATSESVWQWRVEHPGTPGAAERNKCRCCGRFESEQQK